MERSATEKTYAKNATKRRVALLDAIGLDWEPLETDWRSCSRSRSAASSKARAASCSLSK